MRLCSSNGGIGISVLRMVSLEIPGIMLCAAFSNLGILYSRYFST